MPFPAKEFGNRMHDGSVSVCWRSSFLPFTNWELFRLQIFFRMSTVNDQWLDCLWVTYGNGYDTYVCIFIWIVEVLKDFFRVPCVGHASSFIMRRTLPVPYWYSTTGTYCTVPGKSTGTNELSVPWREKRWDMRKRPTTVNISQKTMASEKPLSRRIVANHLQRNYTNNMRTLRALSFVLVGFVANGFGVSPLVRPIGAPLVSWARFVLHPLVIGDSSWN